MAYKDEYEVARLLLDGQARLRASRRRPVEKVTWNLHPPTLRAMGDEAQADASVRGPGRRSSALRVDEAAARARGSTRSAAPRSAAPSAPSSPTTSRSSSGCGRSWRPIRRDCAQVADLVDMVRGYEGVKLRNVAAYRAALADAGY